MQGRGLRLFDTLWHKYFKQPYHLAYTESGAGAPVLLLHGLGASKDIWRPLVHLLPLETYRVLTPDLLGFGESPRPTWMVYTVEDHVRMVMNFLKKRSIITPVTVVGQSMGCLVATHMAAQHPDMVKRLILYEPPLLEELSDFPRLTKRMTHYKQFFTYIAEHPQLAYLESKMLWRVARRVSGLSMTEEQWLPFERSLRNTILAQQTYRELVTVRTPTDIIYGRLDFIVIRQGIQALFKQNRHITLHLITDVHGISRHSARYVAALLTKPTVRQISRYR